MSTNNPSERRATLIARLGLTMTAEFVPLSKSRNAGHWESINWRVTLTRRRPPGASDLSITTDYAQGIGHLPKAFKVDARRTVYLQDQIDYALETGSGGGAPLGGKLKPPSIEEVLYSLLMDGNAIDYPSFEDWAEETGYSGDSRKAEAIYRKCLETGLKLRAMIGDAALAELTEAFQDY